MKFTIAMVPVLFALSFSVAAPKGKSQVVELKVTEKGFEPEKINVKSGTPVVLKVTRKTDATCAKEIQVTSRKIKKELPLNKTVSIDLGSLEKGDIAFACGMDMVTGHIVIQ